MREYHYLVDRDGRIFHDGTEITDPLVLRFFMHAMTRTPEGRYLVLCRDEHNWFEALDTPFVVQRLDLTVERGALHAAVLVLPGDYREPLDPAGLDTAAGHLRCPVRRGVFRARLGRVAVQQLAPFLIDDRDGPALVLAGARYPVRERTPASPQGEAAAAHPTPRRIS